MRYRCEVSSIAGFVQQVAVSYLTHGYVFYSAGIVPDGKDPRLVDEKLVERYGLEISKWTRARRKREGIASVSYLRHFRFFVLLATPGRHPFFEGEAKSIRDLRREPLKFGSYAISVKNGHPHVRIDWCSGALVLPSQEYWLTTAPRRCVSRLRWVTRSSRRS